VQTLEKLTRLNAIAKDLWRGERSGAETAIVLGVLRRRATLDAILAAHSTRKLPLIKPVTLECLRAALFEMLYLDDTPVRAVLHSAVENVKALGRPQDRGFVNALMRSMERGSRVVPAEDATDLRRTLPRGEFARSFKRSVFTDRNHDAAGFLAARASVPKWIAERRLAELGFDRALACLELQASIPRTYLRPVAGRGEALREFLKGEGIPFEEGPNPGMISLAPSVRIGPVFDACGENFVVQDAVASQVGPFVGPAEGARVLDYCAAPGGKTMHLAELVGPTGSVVACDIDETRLQRVRENAERLGMQNVECVLLPADLPSDFAAVLVDAPCSNTGVLARRPEARWRVRQKHLRGLAERQLKILKQAATKVREGGVLVYSTCSLEAEENLGVVQAFLALGGFELDEARQCLPDESAGDGGFMAKMTRTPSA